jgi:hypothetical protein
MSRKQSEATKTANVALALLKQQNEDKWNNCQYTKSIVAIIDVMGIKRWFGEESDYIKQMQMYKAWDFIIASSQLKEVKQDLYEKYGDFPLKYSILSDCVVVSVDVDVPEAFSKIFLFLRVFINSMLTDLTTPFMTRGAIVIGDIFQESNIIFGPALIKAHYMEKNIAVNFRHIIDKEDFTSFREYKDELGQNILDVLFYEADDGYYCFDYLKSYLFYVDNRLTVYPDSDAEKIGIATLKRIYELIEDEINNNKDKRVAKKYKWMRNYFNKTLQWAVYQTDSDDYIRLKRAYEKRRGIKP